MFPIKTPTIYRVTHRGCDFNDDWTTFIHYYLNKLGALQQFTDCISVRDILFINVHKGHT